MRGKFAIEIHVKLCNAKAVSTSHTQNESKHYKSKILLFDDNHFLTLSLY